MKDLRVLLPGRISLENNVDRLAGVVAMGANPKASDSDQVMVNARYDAL